MGILLVLLAIIAIIVSFWWPIWAGAIMALGEGILAFVLFGAKSHRWEHVPELSVAANRMLQKYGHYYKMPFAARDFSSASSGYQLASILLGVIFGFKSLWTGVGVAAVNLFIMGYMAREFNPTFFLDNPTDKMAHQEVIDYVISRR